MGQDDWCGTVRPGRRDVCDYEDSDPDPAGVRQESLLGPLRADRGEAQELQNGRAVPEDQPRAIASRPSWSALHDHCKGRERPVEVAWLVRPRAEEIRRRKLGANGD